LRTWSEALRSREDIEEVNSEPDGARHGQKEIKGHVSDPITDAHEQCAQPKEQNTDANDEEFGSHDFPIL
jgi:hypothetical protein